MRKLLIVAVATMFAFTMNAQKFGVKAGVNMSAYKVNFDSPAGAKMGVGMNFAVLGEMPINDMISVIADLGFNQLGSDYDSRDEADADWGLRAAKVEYNKSTNVNYIKLGVSPKFSFGPAYAFVGPYFAYAINSKEKATWEGDYLYTPAPGTASYDIFSDKSTTFDPTKAYSDDNNQGGKGDFLKKTDIGLNLGVGAEFSGVIVEFNVGLGMTNFMNKDSKDYTDWNTAAKALNDANSDASAYNFHEGTKAVVNPTQKNLFFGLSVGYMLGGE